MSLTNRLKLLKSYLKKSPITANKPVEIGVELTNFCQLNCLMCNRQEMTRPLGEMSWELFTSLVDQTANEAEIYYLYGLGEPLLYKDLFKAIDYCHSKKVPVGVSTNANCLNEEKARLLIDHAPEYILLALDARTEDTYQKIRRGGNFVQTQENIKNYLRLVKQHRPKTFTALLFVEQEANKREARDFVRFWKDRGASAVRVKPATPLISADQTRTAPPRRCLFVYRTLNITWQGDVYPCCLDTNCSFELGNLNNHSIEQLWNSERWQNLRKSFAKEQPPELCRRCAVGQPSPPAVLGLSLFTDLTVKKALVSLEKLPRLIQNISLWRRR